MQFFQRTLNRPIYCSGIGLHSGHKVNLCLRPLAPDMGIVFKRIDLPNSPLISANITHVVDTCFSTTLGKGNVKISTVEHLLSALFSMGVDNVLVEIDACEVPIMDGSAEQFVIMIKDAGLIYQAKIRQFYKICHEVSIKEGDKVIRVAPANSLKVNFTIEFDHPTIRRQWIFFNLSEDNYEQDISRARTFGFLTSIHSLYEKKLGLGGSLDNVIVVDHNRVLNDEGLRFPDEFVRHKVLDFLGDLALLGRPVLGIFTAFKSGHQLNNQLFRKLLSDQSVLQLVVPNVESEQEHDIPLLPQTKTQTKRVCYRLI